MVELAVVALVAAFAVVFAAAFIVVVDCGSDDECSRGGQLQFPVALIGLGLALGTLLASVLRRGRPGLWLGATASLWAIWLVLVWRL